MDPLTHEQVPPLRLAEPVPSEVEGLGFGRDDGAGNDTQACIVDDLAARLDATGESMRHAGD